ncbi:hypothetical protein SGGMMB4_03744 [Sodalis glossinidius str. 'morsitans']|uniref:Uncharacterized protein n=1 Tax=Sodalis glossinidius (strain morsitans) TaxID=343509 RepID=A0A193QKV5_SODGM|nr:hypothetical protein SGGMMB4_03744 [Sodalis glossinidius str. 'morsitans']
MTLTRALSRRTREAGRSGAARENRFSFQESCITPVRCDPGASLGKTLAPARAGVVVSDALTLNQPSACFD